MIISPIGVPQNRGVLCPTASDHFCLCMIYLMYHIYANTRTGADFATVAAHKTSLMMLIADWLIWLRYKVSSPTELFLGNAGTAMRPLTAVVCAGKGDFVMDGTPRMRERPIADLVDGLKQVRGDFDIVQQCLNTFQPWFLYRIIFGKIVRASSEDFAERMGQKILPLLFFRHIIFFLSSICVI